MTDLDDWFNITATFKSDSDVLMDYKQFKNWQSIYFDSDYMSSFKMISEKNEEYRNVVRNNVIEKSKKSFIFWLVSNCETPSRREIYVNELLKHVNIDIYGNCLNKFKNTKKDPCKSSKDKEKCNFDLFSSYKFYLAFENSLCNNYVTEKYWKIYSPNNLFSLNIVPVVKGAKENQYHNIALKNSFINAEVFKTPKSLADYLNYLNQNETAYLEYLNSKIELFNDLKNKSILKKDSLSSKIEEQDYIKRDDFTPFCEICMRLHDKNYLSVSQKNKIVHISKWFNPTSECWDKDEPNRWLNGIANFFGYCI